jgi:hypothetical protein
LVASSPSSSAAIDWAKIFGGPRTQVSIGMGLTPDLLIAPMGG